MSYKSKPEDYTLGSQPENKEKNRAADILPGLLLHVLAYYTVSKNFEYRLRFVEVSAMSLVAPFYVDTV